MMKQSQVVLLVAAVTALQPVARLQRAPVRMAASDVLASDRILIAPALATSNVAKLGEEAQAAVAAGADCLHFNVMDGLNQCVRPAWRYYLLFWQPRCSTRVLGVLARGVLGLFTRTFDFRTGHFTEKLTWGPMMVKALRAYGVEAPIDVQLTCGKEIVDVQIEEFAAAGASYITFHAEGTRNIDRSLGLVASLGCKCGVVLNPSTPTSYLENIMHKVDIILLMSNNPGFKGQTFQDSVYEKARKVRKMIDESGRPIRLEVDGGAGPKNMEQLAACGIDMFVVGRAVFHADDYGAAISELRALAEKGRANS